MIESTGEQRKKEGVPLRAGCTVGEGIGCLALEPSRQHLGQRQQAAAAVAAKKRKKGSFTNAKTRTA